MTSLSTASSFSSSSSPMSARYVFVYGTLRRGEVRDINFLTPTPRFVGYASIAGSLYHLGSYPGLVLGGDIKVYGEVYEISAELEQKLDEIEEVWPQQTGEYIRREVFVTVEAPAVGVTPLTCLVYEIAAGRTQGQLLIEEGDWVRHGGRKSS